MTRFKLPIQIKLGVIKSLYVMMPWLHISSAPVEVVLQGVDLLMTPQQSDQWQTTDIFGREYLQTMLETLANKIKQEI
jgi:hypothetical protein